MALTYTLIRANAAAVNDQVAGFVAMDGHGAVFPVPGSGLGYASTIRSITTSTLPPGAGGTDGLYTVYLNNPIAAALPNQFTINANTDWIIKATGTA